jgi:hypothetical protein
MNITEDLCSQSEINSILIESIDCIYKNPNAIFFPMEGKTMILRIGQKNNAIMINGNEDTGFTHIRNRHNYNSEKGYWRVMIDKNGNEIVELEDPSRFSPYSVPLFDYTKIADSILKRKNLNLGKNKKPDIFDLYTGDYEDIEGFIMIYNLITYKGTSIIHTLFPEKRIYNRKKILNLIKGKVYAKEKIKENIKTIFIPYQDQYLTKYTILIQKKYDVFKEVILITKHNNKGEPEKTMKIDERELNNNVSIQHEIISYQVSDLINLEKIIKQLINEEK